MLVGKFDKRANDLEGGGSIGYCWVTKGVTGVRVCGGNI